VLFEVIALFIRNSLAVLTCLFGVMAIAMGALAAHAGFGARETMWVTTGVRYQLPHVAVLFASLIAMNLMPRHCVDGQSWLLRASVCWGLGVLGFSCGLYGQAFFDVNMGVIVPLGAVLMMLGWLFAAIALIRMRKGN